METIIFLIVIFIFARFTIRSIFDKEWYIKAQDKFDAIKKERIFWTLMTAEKEISIENIFRSYVQMMAINMYDEEYTKQDVKIKKIITKKPIENWNILAKKIQEKDEDIKKLFQKYEIIITKKEINKEFEEITQWTSKNSDAYNFVFAYLNFSEETISGDALWNRTKEFYNAASETTDRNVIVPVRFIGITLAESIKNLICRKIEDRENSKELENALTELEQLKMLQWCIIDYSYTWLNTSILDRFWWRFIDGVFL